MNRYSDVCCALLLLLTTTLHGQTTPELTRQYRGHGISFAYPEDWEVQEGRGGLSVAPPEAHRRLGSGRNWVTHGLIAGFYQPSTQMELAAATDELIRRLQRGNPELRRSGTSREANVGGNSGLATEYANASTQDGILESGILLTVRVANGVWYWMMFCPVEQSATYFPLFGRIMQTVRIEQTTTLPVTPPESTASAVYIEPSISLVRDTVEVRAGSAVFYNWTLTRGSKLVAEFNVEGGLNNKVNVWLLDAANYQRYSARQQFSYFRGTSGTVKNVAKYEFGVPMDNVYYLVIDNGGAWFLPRKVKTYVYAILPQAPPNTIQGERLFNGMYQQLKTVFIFPDFHISIRHCGLENAFSDPDITLCTELVEGLADQKLETALSFVFFHELGHTLLRGWGLPTWDNEDVADEFATVMMIIGHQQSAALQAAQWWASKTSAQEALSKIWIDDRHTVSPQRARNIIRWLNSGNDLVKRWERVLIPNMQTDELMKGLHDPQVDRELVVGELRKRGVSVP